MPSQSSGLPTGHGSFYCPFPAHGSCPDYSSLHIIYLLFSPPSQAVSIAAAQAGSSLPWGPTPDLGLNLAALQTPLRALSLQGPPEQTWRLEQNTSNLQITKNPTNKPLQTPTPPFFPLLNQNQQKPCRDLKCASLLLAKHKYQTHLSSFASVAELLS